MPIRFVKRKREHHCKGPRCRVRLKGHNKFCKRCGSSRVGFGEVPHRALNDDELRRAGALA